MHDRAESYLEPAHDVSTWNVLPPYLAMKGGATSVVPRIGHALLEEERIKVLRRRRPMVQVSAESLLVPRSAGIMKISG